MPLQPGAVLGQYEILAFLGAGGMGEVYRARDSRLGRDWYRDGRTVVYSRRALGTRGPWRSEPPISRQATTLS